jgi:hypothetical protein
MKKRSGNGANSSESVPVGRFFGQTAKKPEPDDRPKRTPADRNTGTKLAKKLAGKVIG